MNKKKILVVDDEGGITRMLKRNLEATNRFVVRTENTSSAALAAAREFEPDFILLDVMMPGMDGGDVAAQIKAEEKLKNVPVVFLSAIVTKEETKPTGSMIGGTFILAKPVKLEDLITCIENHIGK
jgi:DNA-binding response OmpR family regulator